MILPDGTTYRGMFGNDRLAPFDDPASRTYAQVAAQVGIPRNSFDRLIGTQALALGMVLVTRNRKDFADIEGLKMEDWTL